MTVLLNTPIAQPVMPPQNDNAQHHQNNNEQPSFVGADTTSHQQEYSYNIETSSPPELAKLDGKGDGILAKLWYTSGDTPRE